VGFNGFKHAFGCKSGLFAPRTDLKPHTLRGFNSHVNVVAMLDLSAPEDLRLPGVTAG